MFGILAFLHCHICFSLLHCLFFSYLYLKLLSSTIMFIGKGQFSHVSLFSDIFRFFSKFTFQLHN